MYLNAIKFYYICCTIIFIHPVNTSDVLEFQAVRAENEFFKVCRTPELACEVTLQV